MYIYIKLTIAFIVLVIHRFSESVLLITNGKPSWPWLVWLSGLSASLQSKGSVVRFPVR